MSVELPEAYILAKQMNTELIGRTVAFCEPKNLGNYQKLGFINTYLSDFDRLLNHKIESVVSRGNTIRVKLDDRQNLLLAPEYGGVILFHPKGAVVPKKYHLKLVFNDESALTVTLTGMGMIKSHTDDELSYSYLYIRDFSAIASPVENNFNYTRFQAEIAAKNVNLKTALVGKDAVIVGLGNAAFQDIIYRAHLHPKRKGSELSGDEQKALFDAISFVVNERIKAGGKEKFVDFYGKHGTYVPAMGPNMKGTICPTCGVEIQKIAFGGGQVYLCQKCQK